MDCSLTCPRAKRIANDDDWWKISSPDWIGAVTHLGWELRSTKVTFKPAFDGINAQIPHTYIIHRCTVLWCHPVLSVFSDKFHSSSRLPVSHGMRRLCTPSINCVTSQTWKFHNFAILSVLRRQRCTPTALLCCVELACQIM